MVKKASRKMKPPRQPPSDAVVKLDDINANPFRPSPNYKEMMEAVLNFATPFQWALSKASGWEQQAAGSNKATEAVSLCAVAQRIDTLLQYASPEEELAITMGVEPAKLWLYIKEEAPSDLVFSKLQEEANLFHPYVFTPGWAKIQAKKAISRVDTKISEFLLKDFEESVALYGLPQQS